MRILYVRLESLTYAWVAAGSPGRAVGCRTLNPLLAAVLFRSARQLGGHFVEVRDALGDFRHGTFPVVFVFDGDNRWVYFLSVQFRECFHYLAFACSPWNIVTFWSGFIEVLQMDGDYSTFENAEAFDRVKA